MSDESEFDDAVTMLNAELDDVIADRDRLIAERDRQNHKFATQLDHDAINEAIYDAVCDGEGRANARDLLHHLKKRGLTIVALK